MSTPVGDLFNQASTLDECDRATLAGLLLESLENKVDEDVESVWLSEIERRLRQIDTGGVELVSWDDVKATLRKIPGDQHPD